MTSTTPTLDDLPDLTGQEGFVRALARSLLFDDTQVDDVVQQTWVEAIRRPGAASGDGARGWLASVVRSRASNLRREAARRRAREREAAVRESLPSTAELLEREDQRRHVVEAVAALSEPYRTTVLLRWFEELPPRRIAQRLGIPVATVQSRLKRALQQLRERLDADCGGDRRGWMLALVPVAASGRAASGGVLVAKLAGLFAALIAMKHIVVLIVAALVAAFLLSTDWDREDGPLPNAPAVAGVGPRAAAVDGDGAIDAGLRTDATTVRRTTAPDTASARPERSPSVLAANARIRGRLLRPSGAPAASAAVRLFGFDPVVDFAGVADPLGAPSGAGPRTAIATTDDVGRFEFVDLPPGGLHALHADVGGPNATWIDVARTPAPGQVVDLGVMTLEVRGALIGRVVGPDGEPLEGAEVWAADFPGAVLRAAPIDRIDPEGALFLSLPERPDVPYGTAAAASGYHQKLRRHVGRNIITAETDAGFVMLDLPARLAQMVRDAPFARTYSAADGTFRLDGVPPGDNVLVVRKPGLESGGKSRVRIEASGVRDVRDIKLRAGDTLSLRVVDAAGAGVANAEVRIAVRPRAGMSGLLFGSRTQRTDGDGGLVVPGLPRGDVVVAWRRGSGARWAFEGPVDSSDDLELALPATFVLELAVSGAAGASLDDLQFRLWPAPPLGEAVAAGMVEPVPLGDRLEELDADDGGDSRSFVIRGLAAGPWTLTCAASGHVVDTRLVEVGPESTPCSIELAAAVRCAVEVVDGSGVPVHGAEVFVQTATVPAWARSILYSYGGVSAWDTMARDAGRTDERGELTVEGLPREAWTLIVRHPGFGASLETVAEPRERVRVELAQPGGIRGRVVDGGVAASPSKWRITASPLAVGLDGDLPTFDVRGVLQPDGSFEFQGLVPGRWMLEVSAAPAAKSSFGDLLDTVQPGSSWLWSEVEAKRVQVEVGSGVQESVVIDADPNAVPHGVEPARLRGRVTVDGRPAAARDITVSTRNDSWQWRSRELGRTDAAGRFELELAPGTVQVSVRLDDASGAFWQRQWDDLPAGADQDLTIDVTMAELTVQLIGYDGLAANGHTIDLTGALPAGGQHLGHGVTGADGTLVFRVPSGEYEVRGAGARGAGMVEAAVAGVREVVVRLGTDEFFSGTVPPWSTSDEHMNMLVKPVAEGGSWHVVTAKPGGSFALTNVAPGEYELAFWGTDGTDYAAEPARVTVPAEGLIDQVVRVGAKKE